MAFCHQLTVLGSFRNPGEHIDEGRQHCFSVAHTSVLILIQKFTPHVWLSANMVLFGFVTIMQGLVRNYAGLLATRFFLGVFGKSSSRAFRLSRSFVYSFNSNSIAQERATSHTDLFIYRGGHVPRMLLPYRNVVQETGSSKEVLILLLLDHACRRFRRTHCGWHRRNGRHAWV